MATNIQQLVSRIAALEAESRSHSRQLRRLPARLAAPPTIPGVKFVEPSESLWLEGGTVTGDLYAKTDLNVPIKEDVEIVAAVLGFFFKGGLYPAVIVSEGVWTIIGGAAWLGRARLQADLPQGGSAPGTFALTSSAGDTVDIYDNWGETEASGNVALAGDDVGAAWNQETSQWEVWVNNCHDELVEEPEE